MEEIIDRDHDDPNRKQPVGTISQRPSSSALPNSLAPTKPPTSTLRQREELRLATLAFGLHSRLMAADMPAATQEHALRHVRALLDGPAAGRRPNPTLLARSLKQEFDSVYGPAWHCVAGKSFGSFVTHSAGGFIYFSVDSLFFLLFKTQVHVITQPLPKP